MSDLGRQGFKGPKVQPIAADGLGMAAKCSLSIYNSVFSIGYMQLWLSLYSKCSDDENKSPQPLANY